MSALRHLEYYNATRKTHNIPYLYHRVVYKTISVICNVSIPVGIFGKGLLIYHLQNIVISNKCHFGEWIQLFHNVTVGISMGKNDRGKCPQIGNDVTICTGAVILGDISITDKVLVAANAVVTENISEKNVTVGGVPAKIIARDKLFSLKEFKEKNFE